MSGQRLRSRPISVIEVPPVRAVAARKGRPGVRRGAVRYRLDDEDPEQVELRRSGSTLTFADSEEMLWRLHDASTLRVEVDARVGDVDVIVFDLMGAREVVRSVREACGW